MNVQPHTRRSFFLVVDRWLEHRWVRFAAFWLTFVLAYLLVARDFEYFPYILFFPLGLYMFFAETLVGRAVLPLIFGWIIFLTVSIVGSAAPKRRTFVICYIVFIMLLIVNIIGCTRQSW